MAKKKEKSPYPFYKDKPLVRCGDVLYYGCVNDKYVTKILVQEKENQNDLELSKRLVIQLVNVKDGKVLKVLKTSEKNNLYAAIDIANVWLHRALENDQA